MLQNLLCINKKMTVQTNFEFFLSKMLKTIFHIFEDWVSFNKTIFPKYFFLKIFFGNKEFSEKSVILYLRL